MSSVIEGCSAPSFAALQQAAEWYARLRDDGATESDRESWRQWFESSADHCAAWRYVEQVGRRFAPLQQDDERAAAEAALVAPRARTRRQMVQALSLFTVVGVTGWVASSVGAGRRLLAWRADYRTSVGEVRELRLVDGSQLWLNTDSALDVDYTPVLRRLKLLDGELLLDTARDARPLVVESGEGRMRAPGTLFSVRQQSGFTDLAVYGGAVEVQAGTATRIIATGEQVRFSASTIQPSQPAQRARKLWSRGLLLAEEIPLHELLAELGRYHRAHLTVAPEVAGLRVVGTFPLHDLEQVLTLLQQALPVQVRRTLSWWITIESL